jgi:hypothetical protein
MSSPQPPVSTIRLDSRLGRVRHQPLVNANGGYIRARRRLALAIGAVVGTLNRMSMRASCYRKVRGRHGRDVVSFLGSEESK